MQLHDSMRLNPWCTLNHILMVPFDPFDPKAISFTIWLLLRGRCKFIILFKFCNEQRQPREIATTKHHNTLLKEKHFFLMISYKCTQWVLDQRLHPPSIFIMRGWNAINATRENKNKGNLNPVHIYTWGVNFLSGIPNSLASPKSASFITLAPQSISKFLGFKSRWRNLWEWQ